MDTQSTVDVLIELKRRPIELLENEKAEIEYDIAAWADVSTHMSDLTDSLDDLRGFNLWNQMAATSSDTGKLTATATSSAVEASYSLTITQLAQAHSVASDKASDLDAGADESTDLVAAGVLTAGDQFTIEGQTITIDATESLSTLQGKINTAADSMAAADQVTATVIDDHLVITRDNTGDTDITMSDTTGTPLQDIGILDAVPAYKNELVTSEDAAFTVNGLSVTRSSNVNLTDVLENVTLNLVDETDAGEPVTLTVARDRETVKTAILDFVEKYNAVAAKLDTVGEIALSGENPRGAELDALGELFDDSLVREVVTNIRKEATDTKYPELNPVNAGYTYGGQTDYCDSLSDIGIWTDGEENQLLVDDETRLDYMLDTYLDETEQLFRGIYVAGTGYAHGVASDFHEYSDGVSASMLGAIAKRTSRLYEQIDDIDDDIDDMERSLEAYEERLWAQFAAMENAVMKMQNDLAWLESKLGASDKK